MPEHDPERKDYTPLVRTICFILMGLGIIGCPICIYFVATQEALVSIANIGIAFFFFLFVLGFIGLSAFNAFKHPKR